MKVHSIYYNCDETFDRFIVYYKGRGTLDHRPQITYRYCVGMNEQGYSQHFYGMPGRHNGKRIKFEYLPEQCQMLVLCDLADRKKSEATQ